jgi:uncharacterized membrane protein
MQFSIKIFCISFLIITLIDTAWLHFFMKNYFKNQVGFLVRTSMATQHFLAIAAIYLLMTIGFMVFVAPLLDAQKTILHNFLPGALFGLIGFGIYELTNYALLARWPLQLVIVDILWGMFLYGISSCIITYTTSDAWNL